MTDVTPFEPASAAATGEFDLASLDDHRRVRDLADSLLAAAPSLPALESLGAESARPLDLKIAAKLARSRAELAESAWTGSLGIVFAMWGEQRRLMPRRSDNPTGEDSLHAKLDQLGWLFAGSGVDWRVFPVDDGDPDNSAAVAIERAAEH